MNKQSVDWCGYWAACPTPFTKDGAIDVPSFRQLIDYYLGQGVHGLLINGSTGEWFAQQPHERRQVAEVAVSQVAGRVPVVVGCTEFTPLAVAELAEHAMVSGAAGAMATPPPYVRPSPDDIVNFYETVAANTAAPIMVYNIPRRVGIAIDTETISKVADIPGIVAFKNTVGDSEFFDALDAVGDRLRVFGGNFLGERGIKALVAGRGDGYIGGWQLLGDKLPAFFEAVWRGDLEAAADLAAQEKALDRQLWDETNAPIFGSSFQGQMKAALRLMGLPAGYPRRPLQPLVDQKRLQRLAEVMSNSGVTLPT